jgi:predicted ATP-grasp superfamily ATP-dependent carboligase
LEFGRASSFVESIDLPELEQTSRRLLQAIGLTGLVEVEYKRNSATDSFQLLDVNARVWGWHTLGTKHGMDFPYLVWKAIHQEPVHELHAPAGIRWVRMLTDVEAAAAEIRRGRLSLPDYLRSLRPPLDFAVFAPDDPLPALLDIPFLAWVGLKRSLRPLPAAAGERSNVNLPDRKAS